MDDIKLLEEIIIMLSYLDMKVKLTAKEQKELDKLQSRLQEKLFKLRIKNNL